MPVKRDNKPFKITVIVTLVLYVFMLAGYMGLSVIIEKLGLEIRSFVKFIYALIVWFYPAILLGIIIHRAKSRQEKKILVAVFMTAFVIYIVAITVATLLAALWLLLDIDAEKRMPDGNLRVTYEDGYDSEHYYAEPVMLIARRRFTWDSDRMAKSLSKIYDTDFAPKEKTLECEIFVSDDYEGIEVTATIDGRSISDYIEDDLGYQLTDKALKEKGEEYFMPYAAFGETEKGHVELIVLQENTENVSELIASFIQDEIKNSRRKDGRKTWEKASGSIPVLLVKTEENGNWEFNIPFTLNPNYSFIYDGKVTSKEISELFDRELRLYEENIKYEKEWNVQSDELDERVYSNTPKGGDYKGENADLEGYSSGIEDSNDFYNKMNDGYVAIYESELSDGKNHFETTQDAKGNTEVIIYEDDDILKYLCFDRESKNEKCYLYVLYECEKESDGSFSKADAKILDMYAYVLDDGSVVKSGKKAWADLGSEKFREATGE